MSLVYTMGVGPWVQFYLRFYLNQPIAQTDS
jgi:hypothetical protein